MLKQKLFIPPINVAFAPNFERDDVILSLKLLLGKIKKAELDKSNKTLTDWFYKKFSYKYVSFFSSGRAALYFILKSLNLKDDDEVLLQAFTCVAVPNSIIWAGLKPVFIDIESSSLNIDCVDIEKKITPKSKVLIVQHTFGIPANIDKIIALAKKHGLFIIEDCAHSLGATYKNRLLGSFGDAAFFSFGRDKIISSVFGGIAITNNHKVGEQITNYCRSLKNPPTFFVISQLLYPILYAISKPIYNIKIGKLLLKFSALAKLITPAVTGDEKKGQMPNFIKYSLSAPLACLALNQITKLDKLNKHRKKIALIYSENLSKQPVDGAVYLRFPYIVKNKNKVLMQAKKNNFILGDWYSQPIYTTKNNRLLSCYQNSNCPNAEYAAKHTINLPTNINTDTYDANKICNFLIHQLQ